MRSGELAKLTHVSTDTLRHYERVGVLARPKRTEAGYRLYPIEALQRVQLVRRALGVGFTLAELARILKVRDNGGVPCQHVRALAAAKLSQIERQQEELALMRQQLQELLAAWDNRLRTTAPGERAGLLEMLSGPLERRPQKGFTR